MVEIFAGTYFRAAGVRERVLIFAGTYFRAPKKNTIFAGTYFRALRISPYFAHPSHTEE